MSKSKCAPESNGSKKYNDYILQLTRWSLVPIGAWPPTLNTSNSVWKFFVLLQIFICASMVASITGPCLIYVLFEKVPIKVKLNAMGPLLHRIMGSINYWMLLKRRDDIHKLMRHMGTDWQNINRIEEHEIMLQQAKFGRFIAIICAMIMQVGAFLFSVVRAMKTVTIMVGNETITTHPMTCPIYSKIIDTRFSPVNEIALVLQFLSTFIVSSSTAGICSLAVILAVHACGQLNVLYTWLQELAVDVPPPLPR